MTHTEIRKRNCGLQFKELWKIIWNPYIPSGLVYPYALDKSIFYFRGVWCTFFSIICQTATIQNAVSAFSQLFRTNKKLNFFFESGSFVLKSWNMCTEYDKKWYPSMHSMFHAVCYPPVWWNVSAVPAFCPNIYCFSIQIRHFVFYSFLSCWRLVMTGVLTNYSRETHLPFHPKQNVFDSIWQNIQDVLVADTAFWTILNHVSDTAFCLYFQLWSLFSLVSDIS